jgi:hypothetical protein
MRKENDFDIAVDTGSFGIKSWDELVRVKDLKRLPKGAYVCDLKPGDSARVGGEWRIIPRGHRKVMYCRVPKGFVMPARVEDQEVGP